MPTRTLTILFTDIQGFTARTSSETRAGVANLLEEHERLLEPVFEHYKGTVVKTIGDAFLVTFESPTDAVVCGLAIQEVLRRHNAQVEEGRRLKVRVAINVGEVEIRDGDIFGEAVNLAARLEGITEAGEVFFTEAVYLTMNRQEAPSTAVGEHTFKGIPGTVRVYKVLQEEGSAQIQQISEKVEVGDGQVRFRSPVPELVVRSPRTARERLKGQLIVTGMILVAIAGGWWAKDIISERMVATRAQALLDQKDPKGALMLVETSLDKDQDRPKLKAVALDIIRGLVADQEKPHPQAALRFVEEQLKAHPYLTDLEKMKPRLETAATLREMIKKGVHEYQFFDKVNDLVLDQYPDDPDVPYAAAQQIDRRFIVEVVLPRYQLALDRGHAKTEEMYQAAIAVLSRNAPGTSEAKSGFKMIDQAFPERKLGWAQDALAHGTGFGLLNAWPILEAARDPKLSQPLYAHYRTAMLGKDVGPATEAIAAISDEPEARHAQKVLKDALEMPKVPEASRPLLKAAAETLEKRFGPLPEQR